VAREHSASGRVLPRRSADLAGICSSPRYGGQDLQLARSTPITGFSASTDTCMAASGLRRCPCGRGSPTPNKRAEASRPLFAGGHPKLGISLNYEGEMLTRRLREPQQTFSESDPVGERQRFGRGFVSSDHSNRLLRSPIPTTTAARGLRERQLWLWLHQQGTLRALGLRYSPITEADRRRAP